MIVGVTDLAPEEMKAYKRESIYTVAEKKRQISGFAHVHEVVSVPHLVMTEQFMKYHYIDLVAAGSDYADPQKGDEYYAVPYKMGKFATFGRTEGVSTTDIIKRVINHVDAAMTEKLSKEQKSESQARLKTVSEFVTLMKELVFLALLLRQKSETFPLS